MPSAEFETAIQAFERPQTYASHRLATGIGSHTAYQLMKTYWYATDI